MKTYLFDFDGTLVDSMPTFSSVILKILNEYKIEYPSDVVKIVTPLGYEGTAKYLKSLGIESSIDELIAKMQTYIYKEYAENIQLKNHVFETLKQLKSQGNTLNILTASPHSILDICLKRLGVYELFSNIWSCDDFGLTKSNPEIYKMVAKKLGKVEKEIIFLDDNFFVLKTAKKAGLVVYGVFDDSSKNYIEDIENISDKFIKDFSFLS